MDLFFLGLTLLLLLHDRLRAYLPFIEHPHRCVERSFARQFVREVEPPLCHGKKGHARAFIGCRAGEIKALRSGLTELIGTIAHGPAKLALATSLLVVCPQQSQTYLNWSRLM
jgi:hypothetical protein